MRREPWTSSGQVPPRYEIKPSLIGFVAFHSVHVPPSAPGAIAHCKPVQQSAFVVQAAAEGTQEAAAQTRGGVPLGLGTQGRLLQQSTDEAQAWPEALQSSGSWHRFTPVKSGPHELTFSALPLQQSLDDVPPHRLPFGLQPEGNLQRPALIPGATAQVTGELVAPYEPALPQHAASAVQRSPVTLQPLEAWHAMPPPGTLAQSVLQQSLPAEQGSPSTAQVVTTKSDNG